MSDKTRPGKTAEPAQARASQSSGAGPRATAVMAPPAYGIELADRGRAAVPAPVLGKMESFFGHDFSGVEVHPSSQRAPALGALAFTQGNAIHFAPGQFQPHTRRGQELLGHELAHVVQQRQGRVQPTATLGSGMALNDSPELEREADQAGRLAAESRDVSQVSGPPVQTKCNACSQGREDGERAVTRGPLQRSAVHAPIQMARASMKSGPKYNPRGTIDAPDPGGGAAQQAPFAFTAEFEHKPNLDIAGNCGEIRQEIMWDKKEDIRGHGALDDTVAFRHNTWYEDRDRHDKRYGHRADGYTDAVAGADAYYDTDGTTLNQQGPQYQGADAPGNTGGGLKGKWKFRLKAIDTCNHDAQIGDYDYVTVKWS
jgi:hypothetical protein